MKTMVPNPAHANPAQTASTGPEPAQAVPVSATPAQAVPASAAPAQPGSASAVRASVSYGSTDPLQADLAQPGSDRQGIAPADLAPASPYHQGLVPTDHSQPSPNHQDRASASRVQIKTPSAFAQYRTLLGKDLRREFRTKEMLTSMGVYALLVLVVYGAALSQTARQFDILQMSGGLLWAFIVFTSLLGLNRSFAHEKENGCLEGILLVPLDRSVVFLAKATSNLLFLLAVEAVVLPLFWFFFLTTTTPAPTWPMMLAPLAAGTVGIAGIGTMLSTITVNTRGSDVLLAVLFIPLVFPLLYACVSATTVVVAGGDIEGVFRNSLLLVGGYDVVMILLSWVLYDFVVSA